MSMVLHARTQNRARALWPVRRGDGRPPLAAALAKCSYAHLRSAVTASALTTTAPTARARPPGRLAHQRLQT